MKYFLDSAKLDEIKYAYHTFGIDGVTTNPRHIMLSGKPFLDAIHGIADWIKEEGLEGVDKFPVSVEINPHLDTAEEMIAAAHSRHAKSGAKRPRILADCGIIGAAKKPEHSD